MINVLAGSKNDAALIARAAGSAARIVTNAAQFVNGDDPVECLILGCRHPIPAETIELLGDIERKRLWIPLILVTDREPEAVRRLSDVKASAVAWFADLQTELPLEIEAARGSVPLLRLAEQAGEATLPPALRTALPYSLRAATDRPVRSVNELAAAVRYSPITLSKAFSTWHDRRTTLSRFLAALVILRARQLRSSGLNWNSVSMHLGFARETLQRKSKRWRGCTLVQLEKVPPDRLLKALVEQYLRPTRPGDPKTGSGLRFTERLKPHAASTTPISSKIHRYCIYPTPVAAP
ncbi:MAG: helix-turn-helix transcriptional regulator [Gemmatimonadales bacterium]|nr:helix-turn-helix transcriptional regulator [Gemmatimonadales bacterium]MYG48828.1 helix-turn-helix transcriptional regulator [Gemmatimonadales bacterium]MYK01236.1 helix-turn-helix transcriptional regulator [Candidatus Palauibacter ramosifaciens]